MLAHVHNQLNVESTDSTRAILCLGAWNKLGLINTDDIKVAMSQPDVAEHNEGIEDEFGILYHFKLFGMACDS